ncbi:hypothetical protein M0R04_13950 [Candidatus Dojkabacteria bacterium]|jgi:hypothetical protein|nr:hypothetical protein [Candidatus Dojkabacteria bacterium]
MELNLDNYLKHFKVYNPKTLFPPTAWDLYYWIHQFKCPICMRKLYWNRERTIARCKSVRKDKFVITKAKLAEFGIK